MSPVVATLLVACGGALGAVGRYWAGVTAVALFGTGLPYGTFFVNIVGGFLIGVISAGDLAGPHARALLVTGVLGGFTTFSAFSLETVRLLEAGRPAVAGAYVAATVVLSVSAAAGGVAAARAMS